MESAALQDARTAYAARAWSEAFEQFQAADAGQALAPGDLGTFALAAYLSGHTEECIDALGRAHHGHVRDGAIDRAAGCAYWLAFALLGRGEPAQASGWVSRAMQMLDDDGRDCVERGYLKMLMGIQS